MAAIVFWCMKQPWDGFGSSETQLIGGFLLAIFSLEIVSALLHWRWARAMQRAVETGSEFEPGGNAEAESRGTRVGRFWRRLPGWVRWPLMGIAFVAVAFAEFYAVLFGALLILS
jgi:hypothetical protein